MDYPPIWTPAPGVTLYNADCLEVLPTLAGLDAVITDPPYGISERTMRKTNGRSNATDAIDWAPVIGDDRPFNPAPWIGFRPCVLWGANHYASRLQICHPG